MAFVLRTSGDPLTLTAAVRDRLRELDANQPLAGVSTGEQMMAGSLAASTFVTLLGASFALLASLLAVVGVGGTVAYAVGQRRRELGIRAALGAQPNALSSQVVIQGLAPVLVGLVAGGVLSVLSGRLLSALLFNVAPTDPVSIAGGMTLLTVLTVLACYLPAQRAGCLPD